MALGNSSGASSARQKGQIIKGIRERRRAANYTQFNCGPVAANHSNACSGDSTGNTFYHNGSAPFPVANDVVFSSKRARDPNRFTAGFYKFTSGGRSATVEINNIGVVLSRTNC
tara:strand:+ start:1218 stop:1559 length:342 start_codon:yes stop_codon:yes gene_type:complete